IAQVVEMIKFDPVAFGGALVVTPTPTDRNGRIEKVSDIAVGDRVIRALPDPNPDRVRQQAAGALNDAIVDLDTASTHQLGHNGRLANAHTFDAKIKHPGMLDHAIAARMTEPKRGRSNMLDGTVLKTDAARAIKQDRGSVDIHRRLSGAQ